MNQSESYANPEYQSQPFESPLGLQLQFAKTIYPQKSFGFTLTLSNRYTKPIIVDSALNISVAIYGEERDISGRIVSIWQGPQFQPPISSGEFGALAVGTSITKEYQWPLFYKEITKAVGQVRLRFKYNTDYVESFARQQGYPILRSNIFSNCVVLKPERDSVHVLGDWHQIFPQITRSYLKPGNKWFKAYHPISGRSNEALLKLTAQSGAHKHILSTPNDLENMVHLKNEKEILDFVRLFTALDTHFLFRGINAIEIGEAPDAHARGYGVDLSSYWWKQYKLHAPRIRRVGSDYVITRYLLSYPDAVTKKSKLYCSEENVNSTGKYSHQVAKVIAEGTFRDDPYILLPYY